MGAQQIFNCNLSHSVSCYDDCFVTVENNFSHFSFVFLTAEICDEVVKIESLINVFSTHFIIEGLWLLQYMLVTLIYAFFVSIHSSKIRNIHIKLNMQLFDII